MSKPMSDKKNSRYATIEELLRSALNRCKLCGGAKPWFRCAECAEAWAIIETGDCFATVLERENARLHERLARIDSCAGERCEANGCRPDPCGPVEYHDAEGVPFCAECWDEFIEEAFSGPRDDAPKPSTEGEITYTVTFTAPVVVTIK